MAGPFLRTRGEETARSRAARQLLAEEERAQAEQGAGALQLGGGLAGALVGTILSGGNPAGAAAGFAVGQGIGGTAGGLMGGRLSAAAKAGQTGLSGLDRLVSLLRANKAQAGVPEGLTPDEAALLRDLK